MFVFRLSCPFPALLPKSGQLILCATFSCVLAFAGRNLLPCRRKEREKFGDGKVFLSLSAPLCLSLHVHIFCLCDLSLMTISCSKILACLLHLVFCVPFHTLCSRSPFCLVCTFFSLLPMAPSRHSHSSKGFAAATVVSLFVQRTHFLAVSHSLRPSLCVPTARRAPDSRMD